jgi:site-specific DNA-methyltransferase (adenine-specific)
MIADNTFICGDCKDILEQLPDGFADLCLTDPPYGIKRDKGFEGFEGFGGFGKPIARKQYSGNWDSCKPEKELIINSVRVAKNTIMFGGQFFTDYLPQQNHWIFWDKCQTMPTFGDGELAWTNFERNSIKQITLEYNGLIGKEKTRDHPTQKPVALFVWCLEKYTKPNDLIIDPFCGSGTTALACHKTGRRFICIDKEQSYIDIAKRRYKEAIAQGSLFQEPVKVAEQLNLIGEP